MHTSSTIAANKAELQLTRETAVVGMQLGHGLDLYGVGPVRERVCLAQSQRERPAGHGVLGRVINASGRKRYGRRCRLVIESANGGHIRLHFVLFALEAGESVARMFDVRASGRGGRVEGERPFDAIRGRVGLPSLHERKLIGPKLIARRSYAHIGPVL